MNPNEKSKILSGIKLIHKMENFLMDLKGANRPILDSLSHIEMNQNEESRILIVIKLIHFNESICSMKFLLD